MVYTLNYYRSIGITVVDGEVAAVFARSQYGPTLHCCAIEDIGPYFYLKWLTDIIHNGL